VLAERVRVPGLGGPDAERAALAARNAKRKAAAAVRMQAAAAAAASDTAAGRVATRQILGFGLGLSTNSRKCVPM
jgi:hypothetical protein